MKKSALVGACGLLAVSLGGCGGAVDVSLPSFDGELFGACILEPWSSFEIKAPVKSSDTKNLATAPPLRVGPVRDAALPVRVSALAGVTAQVGSWRQYQASLSSAPQRLSALAAPPGVQAGGDAKLRQMFLDDRVVNMCIARPSQADGTAIMAGKVIEHEAMKKIDAFHQQLIDPKASASNTRLSASELRNYVQSAHDADVMDAFSSFVDDAACQGAVAALQDSGTVEARRELRRAAGAVLLGSFMREYVRAYFSNGKFISGQLKLDDLLAQFPDLNQLPADLRKQLNDQLAKLKVGTDKVGDGLVTRTGDKIVFPPISAVLSIGSKTTFTMTDVDFNAVSANLIRVVLEALFDTYSGLPATSGATGTKVFPAGSPFVALNLPTMDQTTQVGRFTLVTADDLTQINRIANGTEGVATALTGQVIRGVNIVSLNNEAMAKAVETAVGVTARKAADVAGWCAYASIQRDDGNRLLSTARAPQAKLHTVRITVDR